MIAPPQIFLPTCGYFQHPSPFTVPFAAGTRGLVLATILHNVKFAAAEAKIDWPAEPIEKSFCVRNQFAIFLHQPNTQHVKANAIVIDKVAEARQKKRAFVVLRKLACAIENQAAGGRMRSKALSRPFSSGGPMTV